MTKQEFVTGLKDKIKNAKKELTKKRKTNQLPEFVNPEELLEKEYANIVGLYEFMKSNEDFSPKEVEVLIKKNSRTFKFLNHYIEVIDNALEQLLVKKPLNMASKYLVETQEFNYYIGD